MTALSDVILHEYAQTAEQIRRLKQDAYQATPHAKYAYRSPDGKTFRNGRPAEAEMQKGWTYAKVEFERATSHMSPGHPRWGHYRNLKRRATLLMAARRALRACDGAVPEKSGIATLLSAGLFRPHARTAARRKSLAYAAYRLLRKLDNRLREHPERFRQVGEWAGARQARKQEVFHV